jgi:hypothetical protein
MDGSKCLIREATAAQEEVKAAISTNQSAKAEFEGTVSKQTVFWHQLSVLTPAEQQTQSLYKEPDTERHNWTYM